jgi:hypothetical protein
MNILTMSLVGRFQPLKKGVWFLSIEMFYPPAAAVQILPKAEGLCTLIRVWKDEIIREIQCDFILKILAKDRDRQQSPFAG